MSCSELHDAAGELALDLLGGVDRARALAHLESCPSCRHEVASLTEITEDLLLLTPAAEPSPRFADGVLARVAELAAPAARSDDPPRPLRRRPHAWPVRALAAAAVTIALLVAVVLARTGGGGAEVDAATAEMRTATGQSVGSVSLAGDEATTLTMSVPGWIELVRIYGDPADSTYWLAVEHDDGTRDLHPLALEADYTWTVPLDVEPHDVATVSVLDEQGRLWCSARFE